MTKSAGRELGHLLPSSRERCVLKMRPRISIKGSVGPSETLQFPSSEISVISASEVEEKEKEVRG